jgi:hypothetical protein
MHFEIIGSLFDVETIAVGASIRELQRLIKMYGRGRWRKRKGKARVKLDDQLIYLAEIHWYEAHGIGKRDVKIKRFLS